MYRTYLSTLALGLLLAVLVVALPAANDKRQGIDNMLHGIEHIPDDVMSDPYLATAKGVGQATVITPSSSSAATPTPTPASSSKPVHSSASPTPTPTAGAEHGAQSPSPASATGEPSKTTPAPKPSKTTSSEKEQLNPLNILKPIAKFLGMTD